MKVFSNPLFVLALISFYTNACNDNSFDTNSQTPMAETLAAEIEKSTPKINSVDLGVTESTIEVADRLFVNCGLDQNIKDFPVKALLYQLEVGTTQLPDFSQLTAMKNVCLSKLDIAERNFDEGFPGVDDLIEWFALDIRFMIEVPEFDTYTFYINSDDGSKLYIDNELVVDNDGSRRATEKFQSIELTSGIHEVKVEYFQGPKFAIALELFWESSQIEKSIIPSSVITPYINSDFDATVPAP